MQKLQDKFPFICKLAETIIAIFILIAMSLYAFHLVFQTNLVSGLLTGETNFSEILEAALSLVIGIEFIEMLCRPDSQTVLEVLIFLIARHMIIETPSPAGLVMLVSAVCILCVVRRALHIVKLKTQPLEDQYQKLCKNQEEQK